jgi:hypothetical protein
MRLEIESGWGENFLHPVQAERIKFVNLAGGGAIDCADSAVAIFDDKVG